MTIDNIRIVVQELKYFITDGYLNHYPEQKEIVINAIKQIEDEIKEIKNEYL
jgi:hypothetical protein